MAELNREFIDREELIASLTKLVLPEKDKQEKKCIAVLVHGLAGSGKSALVGDFLEKKKPSFSGVNLPETEALSAEPCKSDEIVSKALLKAWETPTTKPKCLFLDGLADDSCLPELLKRFKGMNVRLVVTSRNPDFGKGVIADENKLKIGPLAEEEGIAFLRGKLRNDIRFTDTLLKQLVADVGGNLLALNAVRQHLSTANVDTSGEVLRNQLDQNHQQQLLNLPLATVNLKYPYPVENFNQIFKEDFEDLPELAMEIFRHLSLCAPGESVDTKFVQLILKAQGKTVREIKNGLAVLVGKGLVVQENDAYAMPPLVSAFGLGQDEDKRKADISHLVEALLDKLGTLNDEELLNKGKPFAAHLLRAVEFADAYNLHVDQREQLWTLLSRFHHQGKDPATLVRSVEHRLDLLKKKQENDEQRRQHVELLCALIEAHYKAKDYTAMKKDLHTFLEILKPFGYSDPLYAAGKERWAAKKYLQLNEWVGITNPEKTNNISAAKFLLTIAMQWYAEKATDKTDEVGVAKELAVLLLANQEVSAAHKTFMKAEKLIRTYRKKLNSQELMLKTHILYELGVREEARARIDRKHYRKAWKQYQKAYEFGLKLFDEKSAPANLRLMQMALGRVALSLGKGADAEKYFEELLKTCQGNSPAVDREKADLKNLLGIANLSKGQVERSLDHFHAAMALEQSQSSPDAFFLALIEINFGVAYLNKQAFDAAESRFHLAAERLNMVFVKSALDAKQKAVDWETESGLIDVLPEKQRSRAKSPITIQALLDVYLTRPVAVGSWED